MKIMMHEIKLNLVELRQNKFWKNDVVVSMVTLYENWKYIKHLPLNDETLTLIKGKTIKIDEFIAEKKL